MSAQSRPYTPFAVSVLPDRSEVVVVPTGELDLASVDDLARQVRELRHDGFDRIVIDLRRLDFIDSSGLQTLLALHGEAARDGQHLTLVPGSAHVQRLFELTGTRGVFAWRDY